ncbi:MAG: PH domain-containing protein [Oscillospiraceae bacterium]|nr:PH domain-containing protein [Oscillospiraceae bacterium]
MRFKGKVEWLYLCLSLGMVIVLSYNLHKLITDAEYRQSFWGIVAVAACVGMLVGLVFSSPLVLRNHCELGEKAILYRFGWVKHHIDYAEITGVRKVTNHFLRLTYDLEVHYDRHGFPHCFVFSARDEDGFVTALNERVKKASKRPDDVEYL